MKITIINTPVAVFERGQQFWTTSTDIANNFDKRHDNVLSKIEALQKDVPYFKEMYASDSYGRSQKYYEISRDGFSLLVMSFTGKKALRWKVKYIDAFNRLEKAFLRRQDPEHKQVRTDVKRIRRTQTDAIQIFIEYAKENGSTSPEWYYTAFTKMENQLLFIIDKGLGLANVRDMLNTDQLFQIGTADQLITKTIHECIRDDLPYKDIFLCAKRKVAALAELVGMSEVPAQESMLGHNSKHMIESEGQEAATSCPEPESCENQPSDK